MHRGTLPAYLYDLIIAIDEVVIDLDPAIFERPLQDQAVAT